MFFNSRDRSWVVQEAEVGCYMQGAKDVRRRQGTPTEAASQAVSGWFVRQDGGGERRGWWTYFRDATFTSRGLIFRELFKPYPTGTGLKSGTNHCGVLLKM